MGDDPKTIPMAFPCQHCGAFGAGGPPHGWGVACPQKVRVDDAYVEMLDAQRMSFVRSGAAASDAASAMRDALGGGDDEAA